MSLCPKCRREFAVEGGFCPYDGVALQETQPDLTERSSPPVLSADIEVVSFLDENAPDILDRLRNQRTVEYDHLVGTELDGRYAIEEKIGEGGMGVVFRGRHVVIEKPVAIKVLKREVASDQSVVKRFVQEARAASRIGHPNIIDVTDFGSTSDGMTYQVMEFIDGETLAAVLKRERKISVPRALEIAAQIARALLAAHGKGIVHRDLKPENVFLVEREGRRDFVKIVDFGIAKVAPMPGRTNEPRITRVGTVFGTPEYMAPEQAAGREDADHRIDIYALGTILYELLTGMVPHRGESAVRTLAMQMLDAVIPPRKRDPSLVISDELEGVIIKSLAKMPEDRYQSMAEFLDALGEATSETEFDLERLLLNERQATAAARGVVPPTPDPAGSASFTTEMETIDRGIATAERSAVGDLDTDPAGESLASDELTASDFVPTENWTQNPLDAEATREVAPRTPEPPRTAAETSEAPPPGRRRRKSSVTHDPAFVTQKQLPIFDEPDEEELPIDRRRSLAPWIAVGLLLIGGVAAAGWYYTRGAEDDSAVATPSPADAAAVADAVPAVDARPPVDASSTPSSDARSDGTQRLNTDRPAPGQVEIRVKTVPPGGSLYIGDAYAGSDGLNVARKRGTRLEMICRKAGYGSGKVVLKFDQKAETRVCELKRHKKCVPGIKNPFDDCPE